MEGKHDREPTPERHKQLSRAKTNPRCGGPNDYEFVLTRLRVAGIQRPRWRTRPEHRSQPANRLAAATRQPRGTRMKSDVRVTRFTFAEGRGGYG